MTDEQIIKALECCKSNINLCNSCPMDQEKKDDCTCGMFLAEYAISLINRQKAEIERLENSLAISKKETKRYAQKRAEAIKEFAERLKFNVTGIPWCEYGPVHREIDNLVKEMVGDGGEDG